MVDLCVSGLAERPCQTNLGYHRLDTVTRHPPVMFRSVWLAAVALALLGAASAAEPMRISLQKLPVGHQRSHHANKTGLLTAQVTEGEEPVPITNFLDAQVGPAGLIVCTP